MEGAIEEEETFDNKKLQWTTEALEALRRVPEGYQRRRAKAQVEKSARVQKIPTITKDLVREAVGDTMDDTRELQEKGTLETSASDGPGDRAAAGKPAAGDLIEDGDFKWTPDARARLQRVPEGFMRTRTQERMEACAEERSTTIITLEIAEEGIEEARRIMEEMIRKQNEEGGE